MSKQIPPLKTFEFYSYLREKYGATFLQKTYSRGHSQIGRWCANPDFCETAERNPIDRYESLLSRLIEDGDLETARAIVSRQAAIVGCELKNCFEVEPDKGCIHAECLDDYPPVTQFHQAIAQNESAAAVRYLRDQAKRELDETYALYVNEQYGSD